MINAQKRCAAQFTQEIGIREPATPRVNRCFVRLKHMHFLVYFLYRLLAVAHSSAIRMRDWCEWQSRSWEIPSLVKPRCAFIEIFSRHRLVEALLSDDLVRLEIGNCSLDFILCTSPVGLSSIMLFTKNCFLESLAAAVSCPYCLEDLQSLVQKQFWLVTRC